MARRLDLRFAGSWILASFATLGACGPAPEAAQPAVVASADTPPPPDASALTSASASVGTQPATRAAKRLELPPSVCTVSSIPRPEAKGVGLGALFVADHPIGHVAALGDVRKVVLGFAEPKPAKDGAPQGPVARASVEVEGSAVTLRGAVPTTSGTSDDLRLYPVTQVVRDGWLHYTELEVEGADAGGVAPETKLPDWITPTSLPPFKIPCAELSVFAGKPEDVAADSAITADFTLEDEAKRAVAAVRVAKQVASSQGLPVQRLTTKGGRSQIRIALTNTLFAEGWVPAKLVKKREWGGIGYGTGSGSLPARSVIQCTRDVPLWVNAKDGPYEVGVLHPNNEKAGWDSEYGYHVNLQGGDDDATPYVPEHELGACFITKRARKPRK